MKKLLTTQELEEAWPRYWDSHDIQESELERIAGASRDLTDAQNIWENQDWWKEDIFIKKQQKKLFWEILPKVLQQHEKVVRANKKDKDYLVYFLIDEVCAKAQETDQELDEELIADLLSGVDFEKAVDEADSNVA